MGTGTGADDPDLDELVPAWNNPGARPAKLRILGPVTVTAYGPLQLGETTGQGVS